MIPGPTIIEAKDELELFSLFVESVLEIDPDVLIGFELQKNSLGYLIERYRTLRGLFPLSFVLCFALLCFALLCFPLL